MIQSVRLKGAELICCGYTELQIPEESIVYCDPPYRGATRYDAVTVGFDHDAFWQWCRDKEKEGHRVFISEYDAPDDFVCLWKKEVESSLGNLTGSKKEVEKLFVLG